jgi:hypothetical protein
MQVNFTVWVVEGQGMYGHVVLACCHACLSFFLSSHRRSV